MYYSPFEAYLQKYIFPRYGLAGRDYTIREIPFVPYVIADKPKKNTPRTMAESFLESILKNEKSFNPDDPFQDKLEIGMDKIDLFLELIAQQEMIRYENLASLYNDLFTLDKMQKERPFPENYKRDQIWLKITEDKLRVYDLIRKEMKDHAKTLSFISKELVDSLIDFKRQKQKERMFSDEDFSSEPAKYDRKN